MANTPNDVINNAAMVYINRNECHSFSMRVGNTSYVQLSGDTPCGEVIIFNSDSTNNVLINHEDAADSTKSFLVSAGGMFTFRGLTHSGLLSAKSTASTITLYWRTQYFSFNII